MTALSPVFGTLMVGVTGVRRHMQIWHMHVLRYAPTVVQFAD